MKIANRFLISISMQLGVLMRVFLRVSWKGLTDILFIFVVAGTIVCLWERWCWSRRWWRSTQRREYRLTERWRPAMDSSVECKSLKHVVNHCSILAEQCADHYGTSCLNEEKRNRALPVRSICYNMSVASTLTDIWLCSHLTNLLRQWCKYIENSS